MNNNQDRHDSLISWKIVKFFCQYNGTSLHSCLREIRKEQADIEVCLSKLEQGTAIRDAPKNKWVIPMKRLCTMVCRYPESRNEDKLLNI